MVCWYVNVQLDSLVSYSLHTDAFTATNSKGEKESFWGFDHLGQVMDHLGLERPRNNRGWKSML